MQLALFSIILSGALTYGQPQWGHYKAELLGQSQLFSSWTPSQKASLIMDYVYAKKPSLCVEIGSFRGAVSLAIGKALSFNKKGIVHCIDTWRYDTPLVEPCEYNQLTHMWDVLNADGDLIYLDFISKIFRENLRNYINPLRIDSVKGGEVFPNESIDLLYLDGNYSEDYAHKELLCYFPKVKRGGKYLAEPC